MQNSKINRVSMAALAGVMGVTLAMPCSVLAQENSAKPVQAKETTKTTKDTAKDKKELLNTKETKKKDTKVIAKDKTDKASQDVSKVAKKVVEETVVQKPVKTIAPVQLDSVKTTAVTPLPTVNVVQAPVATQKNFVPVKSGVKKTYKNLTTEKFIAVIGEQAREQGQKHGIYASVAIAQAILESGSGNSELSKAPNNNLFGIKGVWKDNHGVAHSKAFRTQEDDGTGNKYTIMANFRTYPTIQDSIEDYANLLTNSPVSRAYRNALKCNAKTYEKACYALQGVYATDTDYAQSLISIIRAYDLTRFDTPLEDVVDGTIYDPESEVANVRGYRSLTNEDYANLAGLSTAQLGKAYVWGGETEKGFDCSGLVKWAYKQALGIEMPRTAAEQSHMGTNVEFKDLRMGDLLFFEKDGGVYHVGIYLGDGCFIHASQSGDYVKVTAMKDFKPSFAKRVIKFKPQEETPVVPDVPSQEEIDFLLR